MISTALKLDIFFKSFFVQAAWNMERMQNMGFLFSTRKALKHIWQGEPKNFEAACERASSGVNTHPYFSPAMMGVTLHIEEKISQGLALPDQIESAKQKLAPPLNALGSLWFWEHLRLLAFLISVPVVAMSGPVTAIAGIAIFFVLFNSYHLWTRWRGLDLGLRYGSDMVPDLLSMFPSSLLQSYRRISTFALGLVTPIVLGMLAQTLQNRMPVLVDAVYLPEQFFTRIGSGVLAVAIAICVMYQRWLSVYQLIAIAIVLVLGVTRWV